MPSGDPVTPEGRLAATALMVLGIGLYSAITAAITSYFVLGDRNGDRVSELERLAGLHDRGKLTDAEYGRAKTRALDADVKRVDAEST